MRIIHGVYFAATCDLFHSSLNSSKPSLSLVCPRGVAIEMSFTLNKVHLARLNLIFLHCDRRTKVWTIFVLDKVSPQHLLQHVFLHIKLVQHLLQQLFHRPCEILCGKTEPGGQDCFEKMGIGGIGRGIRIVS